MFLHTAPRPTDEEAEKLAARGIAVVEGEVASLEIVEDRLAGVRMGGGEVVALRALAVMPRVVARTEMFKDLGLETTGHPSGLGEHVEADATGLTAVPGVWVAGNVADLAETRSSAPPKRASGPGRPSTPTSSPRTPNAR